MSKPSLALSSLPPEVLVSLQTLGERLAVARLRRKESQRQWASRLGVSVPTLIRLEKGDPSVSMGVYASALWLLGLADGLGDLAEPGKDVRALESDVRQASRLLEGKHIRTVDFVWNRRNLRSVRGAPSVHQLRLHAHLLAPSRPGPITQNTPMPGQRLLPPYTGEMAECHLFEGVRGVLWVARDGVLLRTRMTRMKLINGVPRDPFDPCDPCTKKTGKRISWPWFAVARI